MLLAKNSVSLIFFKSSILIDIFDFVGEFLWHLTAFSNFPWCLVFSILNHFEFTAIFEPLIWDLVQVVEVPVHCSSSGREISKDSSTFAGYTSWV